VESGWFAIEIHRMTDRPEVGPWSAGCQGLHARDFPEFWALIEASSQSVFEYYLFRASDLAPV
jgi:hypothetical protein